MVLEWLIPIIAFIAVRAHVYFGWLLAHSSPNPFVSFVYCGILEFSITQYKPIARSTQVQLHVAVRAPELLLDILVSVACL